MYKTTYRKALWLILVILSRGGLSSAQAQQVTVSGTVLSATDQKPFPGVTVRVEGSNLGTSTDAKGNYRLQDVPRTATLVFSAIGFITSSQPLNSRTTLNITLKPEATGLNEVVVVGYGTSSKKDLTGSVGTVRMADQEKRPAIGTAQLLEGQVSGVRVTQNQSQPGGAVFSVRIRGTNSINSSSEPLYVVDGYAGADISALDPSDIASIDVLKDASATAIYGSRGANGVVIITTKRGHQGKPALTLNAYTGIQQVSRQYDMMDATQYATYLNDVQQQMNLLNNTHQPLPYTQDQINQMGKGTNWQDAIFRLAPVSNLSLGFNGGDENTHYFLSMNYFNQQGIIIGSNYKRGILRFNLDQDLSDKIKVGVSSQVSYGYQNAPSVNTSGGGTTPSVLWDAVRFNPALPVRDSSGAFTYKNDPLPYVFPTGNPIAYATQALDANYDLHVFANTDIIYEPIKGLQLKSTFGVDYLNGGEKHFVPSTLYVGSVNGGSASQQSSQNYNWLNENTLTYDHIFNGIHAIDLVGGFTLQHWYDRNFSAGITGLSTNNESADNLGIGTPGSPSSSFTENVLASYFARANYRLMDKYLFTFTMRADGSSRFGENNKWGYFPSGAFAWRVTQEKFMQNLPAVSNLKVRLSYGVTGNQEIGSYHSLSSYSSNHYSLGVDPSLVVGISPSNIPNPNLKWESTASFDAGIDLGLWKDRVSLTADFYHKKTSNLLLNVNIPQSSGYKSILENAGAVQNQGFELGLTTRNIEKGEVHWTTTFNFSANRNKILSLGSNQQIYAGDLSGSLFPSANFKSAILLVGHPIGSFYGYTFDGIWQSQEEIDKSGTTQAVHPGDPMYRDLNGDSTLNGSDRKIIGHALPKFTYGFTSDLTVGRFNMNLFVQGVYGNKILNENLYEIENGSTGTNKLAYVANKSWTGAGTTNTLPSVASTLRRSTGVTSDVLESGSFLRIKSLTVSYNVPLPKITSVFKSSVVYVTVQNLYTFTNYSGYDPEVNSFSSSNALSLGTDYNAYPNYRTYLVGVKFGF